MKHSCHVWASASTGHKEKAMPLSKFTNSMLKPKDSKKHLNVLNLILFCLDNKNSANFDHKKMKILYNLYYIL